MQDILVNGRYRLLEIVGRGGMGTVWRGRDEMLDREVAVKQVILPDGLSEEQRTQLTQRALREARSAARLNHPGIVTVFDVADWNNAPLIVMEFVSGRSLAEVIKEDGPLPPARVAEIGLSLLDALHEAHEAGIVHRDLKPANILLTARRVLITDFGIASLAGDPQLTKSGVIMGTPAYMSPEQAQGLPATPASDLWSFGATLYAAVEGNPPFNGPDFVAVLSALLIQEPAAPRLAGPLTPILGSLLQKDPSRRATAGQTTARLAALASPQTVTDRPAPVITAQSPGGPPSGATVPPIGGTIPPGTAKKRRVAVIGAALTTVGVIAAASFTFWPEEKGADAPVVQASVSAGQESAQPNVPPAGQGDSVKLKGKIASVVFSPDGKLIAAADMADGVVRLFDVASRKQVKVLPMRDIDFGGSVSSVAFSPDGKRVVGIGNGVANLWDVDSAKWLGDSGWSAGTKQAVFTADGSKVTVIDGDGKAWLWDPATDKNDEIVKPSTRLAQVAVLGAGGKIAAVSGRELRDPISLFDTTTGQSRGTLSAGANVAAMMFNPDGSKLLSADDEGVRIWDVATKKAGAPIRFSVTALNALAFNADATSYAAGGYEVSSGSGTDNIIRVWDVAAPSKTPKATLLGHTGFLESVAFSPDGKLLVSSDAAMTIRLWDIAAQKELAVLAKP